MWRVGTRGIVGAIYHPNRKYCCAQREKSRVEVNNDGALVDILSSVELHFTRSTKEITVALNAISFETAISLMMIDTPF